MTLTDTLKREALALAAQFVREGTVWFTCNAIERACTWVDDRAHPACSMQLVGDYRDFVFRTHGAVPFWWNSGHAFKAERLAALEAFRNSIPETDQ